MFNIYPNRFSTDSKIIQLNPHNEIIKPLEETQHIVLIHNKHELTVMKCEFVECINKNECLVSSDFVSLLSMHGFEVELKLMNENVVESSKVNICFASPLPTVLPTVSEIRDQILDIPIHTSYQYLLENESYSIMIKILSINDENKDIYYSITESTEIVIIDLDEEKEDQQYVSLFLESSRKELIKSLKILSSPQYQSLPLNKLFIIRGHSKSGKTVYIKQIMKELNVNCYYIELNSLIDHNFIIPSTINTETTTNNILIIDNYYLIEYYRDKISDFNSNFNSWYCYFKSIIIIIRDNTNISSFLNKYHPKIIDLPHPNEIEREKLIEYFIHKYSNITLSPEISNKLLKYFKGYTVGEIQSIIIRFIAEYKEVNEDESKYESIMSKLYVLYPPHHMKSYISELPKISFDDLGGIKEVYDKLYKSVIMQWKYSKKMKEMGIRFPSGILLYGKSGTGKSMIVEALSKECEVPLIKVKSSSLYSKYFGESEENIRKIFNEAKQSVPIILFFDEIDCIGMKRGKIDNSNCNEDRIVSTLLTEMDGVNTSSNGILVIGACTDKDVLDEALLRPGRFDELIEMKIPNNSVERYDILMKLTRKLKMDDSVDLKELSDDNFTLNYSGADLHGLCREAEVNAIREGREGIINKNDFINAISTKYNC